ncbi:hypothetical protein [Ottowia testudinis]|uniref:Uncharacterized protein n=1 Tax=Ottowia testudinis TaxID=2816950 RepID=A0A975H1A9_9BURK|nr:hypothetical protein [Ottowia testudinis]QTD43564.1 hypothetical protein J1M35_10210 [Ottowia testudinis]
MSPKKRPRPKRSGIETEEERTWVEFYRRVRSDSALAAEVLAQLERDVEMKHSHLALYLSCKESLRREKARQARHKRLGFFVRWLAHTLFVMPWQALREFGSEGRDIAIEMLPHADGSSRQTPRALATAAALPPSSPGVTALPRRSRKARPDAPAPAEADAEKADPASS